VSLHRKIFFVLLALLCPFTGCFFFNLINVLNSCFPARLLLLSSSKLKAPRTAGSVGPKHNDDVVVVGADKVSRTAAAPRV